MHLALVYKDIIQFCFEACKVFRQDRGKEFMPTLHIR